MVCTAFSFFTYISVALMLCGCGTTLSTSRDIVQTTEEDKRSLEQEWGVELRGIRPVSYTHLTLPTSDLV